jgi:hypothetical protein
MAVSKAASLVRFMLGFRGRWGPEGSKQHRSQRALAGTTGASSPRTTGLPFSQVTAY